MTRPSLALLVALSALAALALTGCEADSAGAAGSPEAAPDTVAPRVLGDAVLRADSVVAALDRVFRPLPLQTPGEENALRRYLNDAHLASARRLGVRPASEAELDAMVADGRLVRLEESTRHWVLRDSGDVRYVVPAARALLEELGERFHAELAEMGVPPYRLEVTSTLRTPAQQERLRRSNPNAAAGTSAHEFGTTLDLLYTAFAPPLELPQELAPRGPEALHPFQERLFRTTLAGVSSRYSRELTRVFGDVLRRAQEEGLVRVTLERQQPVYHVTVAREL